jgi:hypothetical protein
MVVVVLVKRISTCLSVLGLFRLARWWPWRLLSLASPFQPRVRIPAARSCTTPRPQAALRLRGERGPRNDSEDMMFDSAEKMMELGMRHRRSTVSREDFRTKVFDWLMGPVDVDFAFEQLMGPRSVDTMRFPLMQTIYEQWYRVQPKSSSTKRGFRHTVSDNRRQIRDML